MGLKKKLFDVKNIIVALFKNAEGFFNFEGEVYPYFIHAHNHTWNNERKVEIPIFQHLVGQVEGSGGVLEVGNVLSNYGDVFHDVVDKYEVDEGVINVDAEDYKTDKRFRLIVSISTFEHIGFDSGESLDREKLLRVISNLRGLLLPGGLLCFSVPLGLNPSLDECVVARSLPVDEAFFLMRKAGVWGQVSFSDALGYDRYKIDTLMIGKIKREN